MLRDALNYRNADRLLAKMGKVLELDDPLKADVYMKHFLRARVEIDVSNPLWPGRWLELPSMDRIWFQFRYE